MPRLSTSRCLTSPSDATDYYADTFVNGVSVGRHEGYIDPYEYDITALARLPDLKSYNCLTR